MASPTNNNDASSHGSDIEPLDSLPDKHGWANISTIVRQVDLQLINGYNDDLDAILTFSGIYSAALTAFLVESYRDLQPDPQATMVFLLQQLVLQTNSFVINDRFINSTLSRPTLAPEFTPPSSAQQVNNLWFASLTLSLVCASSTLLVKQCLRGLVPTERFSPRRYLRIRHFRFPGLTRYRIFEIATLLPFLIQLSLLLFFIGLCIFTASVQKSVKITTLSLIALWAFFLLAAAFIPSVDPTCPYKIPILQTFFGAPKKLLTHLCGKNSEPARGSTPSLPPPTGVSEQSDALSVPVTEEEAATSEKKDVDILVDILKIDVVQADDENLRNVMLEAFLQPKIQPEELYKLPFAVLDARLKHDGVQRSHGEFIDMKLLSYQSYTTITYMLALLVEKATKKESNLKPGELYEWAWWLEDSICALLCTTEFQPKPIVTRALYSCLATQESRRRFFRLTQSRSGSHKISLHSVLTVLQSELVKEKSITMLFECVVLMVDPALSNGAATPVLLDAADLANTIIKTVRRKDNTVAFIPTGCKQIFEAVFEPHTKVDSAGLCEGRIATLACIDAIFLDNDFLRKIWPSLSPRDAAGATHLLDLLIEVMRNRLRYEAPLRQGKILDLTGLDNSAYTTITGLAAGLYNTLSTESPSAISVTPRTTGTYDRLRERIIFILLSPGPPEDDPCERDKDVLSALRHLLFSECCKETTQLINSQYTADLEQPVQPSDLQHDATPSLSMVLKGLRAVFVSEDSAVNLISFMQTLFPCTTTSAIVSKRGGRLERKADSVLFDADDQIAYAIPADCLKVVLDLFLSRIQVNETKTSQQWHDTYQPLLFETVFQLLSLLGMVDPNWDKVGVVVRNILSTPNSSIALDAETICDIALNTAVYPSQARRAAQTAFARAASHVDYSEGLHQILTVLELYRQRRVPDSPEPTATGNDTAASIDLDSCLTFRFYLQLLNNAPSSAHSKDHHVQWTRLFGSVLPSLEKLRGTTLLVAPAQECLDLISNINDTFTERRLELPFRRKEVVSLLNDIIGAKGRTIDQATGGSSATMVSPNPESTGRGQGSGREALRVLT